MKALMCLPIIKPTIPEVQQIIEGNKNNFDLFEIWIDYLVDDFSDICIFITDLSKRFAKRIIIVFRRKNAEPITMLFEKRKEIISLGKDTIFIDLDIETQQEDLEFAKQTKVKTIIASFHDYKKTPRTSVLVEIIKKMALFQPTIYKIATFCETEKQAIALLHLLLNLKEEKKDVVILGMGGKGIITRIFGSLWGNEIIFTPENIEEQSAPGQLTKEQLEQIFTIIKQ